MALKYTGTGIFKYGLEIQGLFPLDSREVVVNASDLNNYKELFVSGGVPTWYVGMEVFAEDTKKKYILVSEAEGFKPAGADENQLSTLFKYKGTVSTYNNLPTENQIIGDVWNVEEAYTETSHVEGTSKTYAGGTNWVWNGTTWDPLAGPIDLSNYATKAYVDDKISNIPSGPSYQGSESIDIADNVISVKKVNSSIVSMQSIPVGGTPLADILTAKGINTINAGNLQSVIESLFSKEDWPSNPKRTIPTDATINMSAPNMSFDKTIAVVGNTVKLTASTNNASGNVKVSYSGFDNGWSKELNKTNTGTGNPSPVSSQYNITRASNEYGLTFTVNKGFGGTTIAAASGSNGGAASKEQILTVAPGNNQVTCTASSPVFKIDINAEPKYYALSTLKNTSEEHVVTASNASTISNLQKTGVTNDASVTGVYPIYSNAKVYSHTAYANGGNNSPAATTAFNKTDYATATTISESTLTSLTNGTIKFYTFIGYGKGGFTLQIPSGWKVTEILAKSDSVANTFNGGVGNIPTSTSLTKTFGTYSDTYSQYVFSIQAGNVCRVLIEPKTT